MWLVCAPVSCDCRHSRLTVLFSRQNISLGIVDVLDCLVTCDNGLLALLVTCDNGLTGVPCDVLVWTNLLSLTFSSEPFLLIL